LPLSTSGGQGARGKIPNKRSHKNHKEIELTLRNYRKDGTLFHNHLKVTPLLDNKDKVLYFLGVQYDITYQINAEKEINRLSEMRKTMMRL